MSCTFRKSTTIVDHSGNYLNLLDVDALRQSEVIENSKSIRPASNLKKVKPYEASTSTWSGWKPTIGVLLQRSTALVTKLSPNAERKNGFNYKQVRHIM